MTTEQISKINILIQQIVNGTNAVWSGSGTLKTDDVVKICRQIVEVADNEL